MKGLCMLLGITQDLRTGHRTALNFWLCQTIFCCTCRADIKTLSMVYITYQTGANKRVLFLRNTYTLRAHSHRRRAPYSVESFFWVTWIYVQAVYIGECGLIRTAEFDNYTRMSAWPRTHSVLVAVLLFLANWLKGEAIQPPHLHSLM